MLCTLFSYTHSGECHVQPEQRNGHRQCFRRRKFYLFLELESYLRGRPHGTTATVEETAFLVAIDAGHREAVLRGYPGLVLGILEG